MEQRSYKTYKISNCINDKVYIGQTVNSLKLRFDQHCKSTTTEIGKSIHELAKENFNIELLDDSATSTFELFLLEKKYIKLYDAVDNGYNIQPATVSKANLDKAMKHTLCFTLDEDILNKAKVLADKENRTLSNLIDKILKEYLEVEGKK